MGGLLMALLLPAFAASVDLSLPFSKRADYNTHTTFLDEVAAIPDKSSEHLK